MQASHENWDSKKWPKTALEADLQRFWALPVFFLLTISPEKEKKEGTRPCKGSVHSFFLPHIQFPSQCPRSPPGNPLRP